MADLILKFHSKAEEKIHLLDKVQVKEILHETNWEDLSFITLVHNDYNILSFNKRNDEGMFGLLLNSKTFEDSTVYSNKSAIIDSFQMFLLEKNRFKLSRPFEQVIEKKSYEPRRISDEYEYSNQEYDRKPIQTYTPIPQQTAETIRKPSPQSPPPRPLPRKKVNDKGLSFKGIWWIIGLIYIIFRACS